MKNTGKLLILFILVLFVTMTPVIVSANTNARTLKELRNELQQLKNKKAQQTADKNATKSKINVAKNDIGNKQNEIETNTKDIADAVVGSLWACYKKYSEYLEEGSGGVNKQLELITQMTKSDKEDSSMVFQNMLENMWD